MALNKVEICGVNTSTLPVLNQEEKDELFKRIKAGDEEARELYIKGNLRLVLSVIRRFQNSSENPDDLFQIGCIGLIKAIDNFDTTLQVKFSTYAVPMIVGEIRRYLRDNNSIRVSRSLRDIAYKTIYTRENYMRQHLKEPTIAEIADEIGIDKEMIVYAMDAIQSPVSLLSRCIPKEEILSMSWIRSATKEPGGKLGGRYFSPGRHEPAGRTGTTHY